MILKHFTFNPFQENTYAIGHNGKALIFDPGMSNPAEFREMDQWLKEQDLEPVAVYLTHAHIDHIIGLQQFVNQHSGLPVYLHKDDHFFIENYVQHAAMFGVKAEPISCEITFMEPGEFEWEGIEFDGRFTPGHAPGHISFYIPSEKSLIAGDTLFQRSIGRVDLPGGDGATLITSIKEQLYSLPGETTVYPGHGPATTIGEEKSGNPFTNNPSMVG